MLYGLVLLYSVQRLWIVTGRFEISRTVIGIYAAEQVKKNSNVNNTSTNLYVSVRVCVFI